MKKSELKVLLKHIIKEVKSLKIDEMIVNKDKTPDFFGAVNIEEEIDRDTLLSDRIYRTVQKINLLKGSLKKTNFHPHLVHQINSLVEFLKGDVKRYQELTGKLPDIRLPFNPVEIQESKEDDEADKQYETEGIFVPRGVIKLGPGVDYKTASKIARNYWDIFGEEEDDKGVWQFKTRGNAYCCAVGMFNGKPAILSKTTNPDKNNLITADEMDIPGLSEEIENEDEEEFKNGDKVRLKPPYADSDEVFTLSQWDGRRGWIGDKDGRGWYAKSFQITHVDDIEEESGTGAVGGYSAPLGFRRRKKKSNEMTNPDGTYSDDMQDGCRLSRITGLKEETGSGAVFSGGPTIQTPAWGTKNKEGSPKAIAASKKLGYKPVKSISEEEKKL